MKLIVVALLLAIPASYYLYLGATAFKMELGDFVPTPDNANSSSKRALMEMLAVADDVEWKLSDGSRQRAFYSPSINGAVIIFLHGSPGNAIGFHRHVSVMATRGFGALVIDLPGYGESEGSRAWDNSFVESVVKALDFLEQQGFDKERIGGLGYSMGANTIVKAAAIDDRIAALVLLAGYTNLTVQLQHQFRRRVPGMGYFAIASARWSGVPVASMDTRVLLPQLGSTPVFVVSGTKDYGIPVHMPETLAAAASNGQLWLIEGAGHTGFEDIAGDEFYDRLALFWNTAILGSE